MIVTHTWVKGPLGGVQVGGSEILVTTVPVDGEELPPPPPPHVVRNDTIRIAPKNAKKKYTDDVILLILASLTCDFRVVKSKFVLVFINYGKTII